jgi:AcrR family transcriptional regulator
MVEQSSENDAARAAPEPKTIAAAPKDPRGAIIEALMELASERSWDDITISDVAARANVSLAAFRDFFPSKGAVLAAFSRKIDGIVLSAPNDDLIGEPAKERLFDVLMRRLDALAPYKLGLEAVSDWARRDPLAASALNRVVVNSMRFMLEAAGIDSEGPVGALKLQGLAIAWARVLRVWFRDDDPGLASTMAALDRELTRGGHFVARAEDVNRLASPLFSLALSLFERRSFGSSSRRSDSHDRNYDDHDSKDERAAS